MLLTTYFSKMNQFPEDYTKLIITRFPPKWLNNSKYEKTHLCSELSPYPDILLEYKNGGTWDRYIERFTNEQLLKQGTECNRYLGLIERYIKRGDKICLICYEKDYKH